MQVSSTIYPGIPFDPEVISTIGGDQYEIPITVELVDDEWQITMADELVGYYPASLFSEMKDGADSILWYGYVMDVDDGAYTQTEMGSGRHASEGWQKAAYMDRLQTYHSSGPKPFDPDKFLEIDALCYSLGDIGNSPDPEWETSFFFGGPGCGTGSDPAPVVPTDPCIPNPCKAGSTCVNQGNGEYECIPPTDNPQTTLPPIDDHENGDPCNPDPCMAGTTCFPSGNGYVCMGPPCYPNPCQNGGECTLSGTSNFACDCQDGFTGPTCEETSRTDPLGSGGVDLTPAIGTLCFAVALAAM